MLVFSVGLFWIAAFHILPKGFLVDSAAKKCTQAYSLFFRREIPFENIESFKVDRDYGAKSSSYYYTLYLFRRKWPRRINIFNTLKSISKGTKAAQRIIEEQIEKSWKLPTEEELKQRKLTPGRRFENVAEWVVGIPIIAAVLLLLVILPTLETLWATVNLVQMRSSTTGIITEVSTEDTGQTKPLLKYTYTVNGKEYESSRYLPGLLSEYVEDSRQRFRKEKYSAGRQVTVYYSPGNPARACLKYGWPVWPTAFALFLWGMALIGYGQVRKEKNRPYWLLISSVGPALLLCGFGAGITLDSDAAIEVSKIHWYFLAFGILFVISLLYHAFRRRSKGGQVK
jgi:hypothetical protein